MPNHLEKDAMTTEYSGIPSAMKKLAGEGCTKGGEKCIGCTESVKRV
jgi:hypothetical protein